ncbi:DUF7344 domain-containing protein [Halalkalicoccus tibetensis]|uniref:DUF7344 domain-containing protein n=1 Tax=Halalkalicoccus tibetensis TaxID=175632 RepID=A0ABD5V2X5_9EURY
MNRRTVSSALSLETVFGVLSERRKRYALYVLHWTEGNAMSVGQLARRIAEKEGGGANGDDPSRERIAKDLRQRHVPELVAMNVVEYDGRSETVRYHCVPSLEEWLEHAAYKEGEHPDC